MTPGHGGTELLRGGTWVARTEVLIVSDERFEQFLLRLFTEFIRTPASLIPAVIWA